MEVPAFAASRRADLRFGRGRSPLSSRGARDVRSRSCAESDVPHTPAAARVFLLCRLERRRMRAPNLRHVLPTSRRALPSSTGTWNTPLTLRWTGKRRCGSTSLEFEQQLRSVGTIGRFAALRRPAQGSSTSAASSIATVAASCKLESSIASRRRRPNGASTPRPSTTPSGSFVIPAARVRLALLMRFTTAAATGRVALRAYQLRAPRLDRELGIVLVARHPLALETLLGCDDAQKPEPAHFGGGALVVCAGRAARLIELWRLRGTGTDSPRAGPPGARYRHTLAAGDLSSWCTQRGALIAFARFLRAAEGSLPSSGVRLAVRSDALAIPRGADGSPWPLAELARLPPVARPGPRQRATSGDERRLSSVRRRRAGDRKRRPVRCCWSPTTCTGPNDETPCSSCTNLLRSAHSADVSSERPRVRGLDDCRAAHLSLRVVENP